MQRLAAACVFGAALLVPVVASCASNSTTARYCDLVKVAEAGVDPLGDPSVLNDPAKLKAALLARVDTYSQLATRAPSAVKADATKVRDALITLNNALAKQQYQSAAANTDPAVVGVIADQAVKDAQTRLQSFNASTCRS